MYGSKHHASMGCISQVTSVSKTFACVCFFLYRSFSRAFARRHSHVQCILLLKHFWRCVFQSRKLALSGLCKLLWFSKHGKAPASQACNDGDEGFLEGHLQGHECGARILQLCTGLRISMQPFSSYHVMSCTSPTTTTGTLGDQCAYKSFHRKLLGWQNARYRERLRANSQC